MRVRQRKTLRVEGIVQGVNYRQAARREAARLGINGFARNDPDGSVTIEAEGSREALAEFVAWCRLGPTAAKVDRVEITDGPLVGYDGFARE